MRMLVTAGLLSAALLLAVVSAVQAESYKQPQVEDVTPTVLIGE